MLGNIDQKRKNHSTKKMFKVYLVEIECIMSEKNIKKKKKKPTKLIGERKDSREFMIFP